MPLIADALCDYATASAREWLGDRTLTVGASEIGTCARRVFFSKSEGDAVYGKARDADHEDGWGAKVRGSTFEDCFWEPALRRAYGTKLKWAGPEQRTLIAGFLSGTPDGLLIGQLPDALAALGVPDIEGDCIDLDCKSLDPRVRLDGPKPEHAMQIQAQLGLIRETTDYRPTYGVLSYTNTSFWDDTVEFAIRFDPEIYAEAQARARTIMLARDAAELRPEGVIAGGKECNYCPFTAACGQERANRVPGDIAPLDADLAATVADLAAAARQAKRAAEEAEAQARAYEHELRELLAAAGTKRAEAGGYRVSWSALRGRPSYNHKGIREAAQAAGVDVDQFVTVGEPTDRLVITEMKGKLDANP